jgi:hypothetical protein
MTGWSQAQQRVLKRLQGLGEGAMVRALGHVGESIVGQYRANIAQGRSPRHRFPKLSEPYATRKRKKYGAQPILVASGAMRDSLGFKVTVLGAARYMLECGAGGTDADGVRNGDKALWHIDGTPRMPMRDFGRMPARLLTVEMSKALKAEVTAAPAPATVS